MAYTPKNENHVLYFLYLVVFWHFKKFGGWGETAAPRALLVEKLNRQPFSHTQTNQFRSTSVNHLLSDSHTPSHGLLARCSKGQADRDHPIVQHLLGWLKPASLKLPSWPALPFLWNPQWRLWPWLSPHSCLLPPDQVLALPHGPQHVMTCSMGTVSIMSILLPGLIIFSSCGHTDFTI